MEQFPIASGFAAVLFGWALLVASRRVAGPGDETRLDLLQMTLRIFAWVLVLVGSWTVALCLLAGLGPLLWLAGVVIGAHAMVRSRTADQASLLWLLTVAAERGLPLAPAVGAFAREGAGEFARRAGGLAELLDRGVSLPEALQQCPGLLPVQAAPLIHVGLETGALAEALRESVDDRDVRSALWAGAAGKLIYVLVLLLYTFNVIWFLALKIVPSFEKIFWDFDIEFPASMKWLVAVLTFPGVPLVFGGLTILMVVVLIYALLRYAGWVRWELPGMGIFTRRIHAAAVLDAMALGVRCERPMPELFESLVRWYPTRWVRRRLRVVADEVAVGRDAVAALQSQKLLRQTDAAVLRSARRAGNFGWALKETAEANRRRFAYRIQSVAQLVFTPVILLFGLVVGLMGLALMSSLAKLILPLT